MRNALHLSILAAALTLGATALPASADEITPASAGRAKYPADVGCFRTWFGTMQNICDTPRYFTLAFAVDEPGYHVVSVQAFGATWNNNVQCEAYGPLNTASPWYAEYYASGWTGLATFGVASSISLAATYVPGGGAIYVDCLVNPQGQINVVHITP